MKKEDKASHRFFTLFEDFVDVEHSFLQQAGRFWPFIVPVVHHWELVKLRTLENLVNYIPFKEYRACIVNVC